MEQRKILISEVVPISIVFVISESQANSGPTLWMKSSEASDDELDLQITASHYMDWLKPSTGHAIVLGTAVMTPKSVGRVRLKSSDSQLTPSIEYNLLSDDADRRRMLEGVKLSRQIGRTLRLADFVEYEMTPGPEVIDDQALEQAVRTNLDTYHHGACTVPTGGDADPQAVVDGMGRVRHVQDLRVVDASIFPEILSEPINLTVIRPERPLVVETAFS